LILTLHSEDHALKNPSFRRANDFLQKPFNFEVLHERIRKIFKQVKPYPSEDKSSCLRLYTVNGHRVQAQASGKINKDVLSDDTLSVNAPAYAKFFMADDPHWRDQARDKGYRLYEQLIGKHKDVADLYAQVRGEELLHIRARCLRDFLEVPLESLCDAPMGEAGDYLVLKHPLARSLFQVDTRRAPVGREFLNGLHERGEKLRILLIASNTPEPDIPGVDIEAAELAQLLPQVFERKRIETEIVFLPTHLATYARVRRELRNDKYHIVHYAGHGRHVPDRPDESCLFFWEDESRKGAIKQLRATELDILLWSSAVRFLYLSCCDGGASASAARAVDGDFLGIAEAAVNRGVPAVLAYRWPVSDGGALCLAKTFYTELAEDGNVDVALMRARREVASQDKNDRTWMSPVLFMQD
jgi:CHAT domain-containing protein